jgi:two-component system sensor histidine kinase and response regulator WspE
MNGEVFTDSAMMEIFRAEVETHVESLTAGLLALERDPGDVSHIDEMMRAAHSIKGAARIVGIQPAVRVAHVMEDGFIAAQNGNLTLRPTHVDVLLRGVDMLSRVANGSKDASFDWNLLDIEATPLVAEITAALSKSAAVSAPVEVPVPAPATAPSAAAQGDVTISLPAMFDAAAAETARRAFIAGLDAKAPVVRFELSLTSDLDATGLALLAAVPAYANEATRVELAGASSDLRSVLQATGVERLYSAGGR